MKLFKINDVRLNRKKWALLILSVVLIFGYIKLFYKTYNVNVVPKTADYIIAIDVKRITNTILWNIITTPSQWKIGGISSGKGGEINWRDMVKIPDYIFIFHTKNQPENAWYTVLQVKNENDFVKALQQYQFEKLNSNEYVSKEVGIHIFKNGDKILVGNAATENKKYITTVAEELFIKKAYIAKETLAKVTDAKSHVAMHIAANGFLQQDAIVIGKFDKQKMEINATIIPNKKYIFTQNNFKYTGSSFFTLGFTQPSSTVYNLLSNSSKVNISKALNLNIDSVLLQSNKWYSIDIIGMKPRVDSAITYTYDDDFNKVEKVVVNNVEEPAFNFTIAGDSITHIYNYWQSNNKLEQTNAGQLFVPMPFVKSYCSIQNKNELNITSANYQFMPTSQNINCIFFAHMLFSKTPKVLFNFLPDDVMKTIANIESLQIIAQQKQEQILLHAIFNKKKNDLPLVEW